MARGQPDGPLGHFAASGIAGTVSAIFSTPVDVVKASTREPPPCRAHRETRASRATAPNGAGSPAAASAHVANGGGGAAADSLGGFARWELTCLIDVLSALGDRRDPPLTPEQASCVAKLGSVLFAARLHARE